MTNQNTRVLAVVLCFAVLSSNAQNRPHKFQQLDQEWPTPNSYRTGGGAPGHQYWQNRADYQIQVTLDDQQQQISGSERITYTNLSPDALEFVWLQLDQNLYRTDSESRRSQTSEIASDISWGTVQRWVAPFEGGFNIEYVLDAKGQPLRYTITGTMMRVDLPQPLRPQGTLVLQIKWWYRVNDGGNQGGRCGYELFPADGNYTYHIAQFYPRMCRYDDLEGWQTKPYLGSGEFALDFGDYELSITVPADHIVAATGELQNPKEVLTPSQIARLEQARRSSQPVLIVTEQEARENEKSADATLKTWRFKANNVRDCAFASSRKFIWDAQGVPLGGRIVMAMSYYPKEANPLWEQYSTRAVAHTLRVYSRFTFDYPYPVAISTHAKFTGMEYPMISFNFGRPETDGTYSQRTKYGMISVIIHEVGHNYFPMIVNSDERQWMWMDEGLNSFLQYLAEQEWEDTYPSNRGPASKIAEYMKGDKNAQVPIMSSADYVLQLGNNAYGKPAAALNILRETVLGRELFDYAFKVYANRWKFKHPAPADFFRTMEEASGVDLDWFWRGWFYTTDHVDIAIEQVRWWQISTQDPRIEKAIAQQQAAELPPTIGQIRNADEISQTLIELDPGAIDFYNRYDPYAVTPDEVREYEQWLKGIPQEAQQLMKQNKQFYQVTFKNIGGLVMPLVVQMEFVDGSKQDWRFPAEIWRYNTETINKVFVTDKPVRQITLDPYFEMADADMDNNYYPRRQQPTRFKMFRERNAGGSGVGNPMQQQRRVEGNK